MAKMLRYAAALVAAAVLCVLPIGAWAQSSGGSEVGSFPNASPLNGSERILADQNAATVNLTPVQIGQYLGIPTGWSFPLPITFGGTGANTATAALLNLVPALISGDCLANNGTAILWAICGLGGGNVSTSGTISTYGIPYWATGTTIASLLPGSTGYYCLYWSSLTGAPALSSSSLCPGGTGSMTWPSGGAGIPNYSGSDSWGTSYSASNTIPADFISTLNQNTTGTAANLSGTPALPNGTTATTQTTGDNTTKLATDAFVLANAASAGVSSVAAGGGIAVTGTGSGPYTGAVTVSESYIVRVVTGATDTILSTDCANGVEYTSSSAVAISLPQATGSFASCSVDVINNGTGTDTVTPTTSTINGGSSLAVLPGRSANITALSGNYIAAGPAVVPTTGSGNAVLATSPTLVTPALGIPSGINLTNATAASLPLTALAAQANNTVVCNTSGASASPTACTTTTYAAPVPGTTALTTAYSNATTSYTAILALPSVAASSTLHGECDLIWESSSTSGTPSFGLGLSATPTDLWVLATYTDGTFLAPTFTTITTTATTTVAATLATSAASTAYLVHLTWVLQNGSSANVVTVYGLSNNASYTLTVEPGSSCRWAP